MPPNKAPPQLASVSRSTTRYVRTLVLFSLAFSVMLAAGALVVTGAADGWRVAAETVSRFSVVVFVAALSVEPVAKLFPSKFMRAVAREQDSLMFAFVAAFAMSLVCVQAPTALWVSQTSLPAIFYGGLNGAILVVMFLSYNSTPLGSLTASSWRAMRRIATAYFWLAFTLWDVGRLRVSDHPGAWYGFSLLLLMGVIVVRVARWFVTRQRTREVAEKAA